MRRAMRRISERLLAMAADTDANLGHAIRDQARHFGEAMLRKAKERGSEGWARTAETLAEHDRPLAITLGLYVRSRRIADVAAVALGASIGREAVEARTAGTRPIAGGEARACKRRDCQFRNIRVGLPGTPPLTAARTRGRIALRECAESPIARL